MRAMGFCLLFGFSFITDMGNTSSTTFLCLPPPKRTKIPPRDSEDCSWESYPPLNMSYVRSQDQVQQRVVKEEREDPTWSEGLLTPRNGGQKTQELDCTDYWWLRTLMVNILETKNKDQNFCLGNRTWSPFTYNTRMIICSSSQIFTVSTYWTPVTWQAPF